MSKTTQLSYFILIALILGTGGYCGIKIGESVSLRNELNTLSYMIRITEHLHTAVDGLQRERAHAESQTTEAKTLFLKQIEHTDHHFNLFQKELRKTQVRVLAMPDSEINELRIMLKTYRNRIQSGNTKSPFYAEAVKIFEIYLKKLYEFGHISTLKDYETDILNFTHLKELVQQDMFDFSRKLSVRLSPEELAQLKQELGKKSHLLSKIRMNGSGPWLNLVTEILSISGDFEGSTELAGRYFSTTELFWSELRSHEKSMVIKLQTTIVNRLAELRDLILITLSVGLLALIVQIGILSLVKKWEPKRL